MKDDNMKYNIHYEEESCMKYWQDKEDDNKPDIKYTYAYSYKGLDEEQFMLQLKDTLDPPAADLTDEQIENDFGDVSEEARENIKKYYNFRRKLFDDVVDEVNNAIRTGKSMEFNYAIQPEFNKMMDNS